MKIILILALFLLGTASIAKAETPASAADVVDVGNGICPVSGDKVGKTTFEYQGKRYHFCCKDCVKDFKKDPEKYIAQMKQGP